MSRFGDAQTALCGRYLEIFPRLLACFPAHVTYRGRLLSVLSVGYCAGEKAF